MGGEVLGGGVVTSDDSGAVREGEDVIGDDMVDEKDGAVSEGDAVLGGGTATASGDDTASTRRDETEAVWERRLTRLVAAASSAFSISRLVQAMEAFTRAWRASGK